MRLTIGLLAMFALGMPGAAWAQEAARPAEPGELTLAGIGIPPKPAARPQATPPRTSNTPAPTAPGEPSRDASMEATSCITVQSGGNEFLLNNCNYEVVVVWCHDTAPNRTQARCGDGFNVDLVAANHHGYEPNYTRPVHWIACKSPSAPIDLTYGGGVIKGNCAGVRDPAPPRGPRVFPLTEETLRRVFPEKRAKCPSDWLETPDVFVRELTGVTRERVYEWRLIDDARERYHGGWRPRVERCTIYFLLSLGS